jgi:alanine racemase
VRLPGGPGSSDLDSVRRSEITIDLGALRRNVRRLRELAGDAELWAVVKGDAYGHGARDVARVALEEGARALCVATAQEGDELRAANRDARIIVLGPLAAGEERLARAAGLEIVAGSLPFPDGLAVHVKVDTGMGRWGVTPEELAGVPPDAVIGLASHLATADENDPAFAREQIARFAQLAGRFPAATRHLANSAGTIRFPEARFDAVRCGVALYGLSPFGTDPRDDDLEPVLSWRSYLAQARTLRPGESTGYGRRFVAHQPTRVGVVPVGYADGLRRGMQGAEVLVGGARRRIVGAVSMDAFAVELEAEGEGTPVSIVGDGLLVEEHARHLGTINYEITCAISSVSSRADRRLGDG